MIDAYDCGGGGGLCLGVSMRCVCVGLHGCVCVYENENEKSVFSNAAKVLRDPHCGFPWKLTILFQKQMAGSLRKGHGYSHFIFL